MATIQIKRFDEHGLTPADKGSAGNLAYGELAINTTDLRVWVGHSDTVVKEVTNQVIFQPYDSADEENFPQPEILCNGQFWYNTHATDPTGQRLYVSLKDASLGGPVWAPVDGESTGAARYLGQLYDVYLTSETDQDILVYTAENGIWKNKTFALENMPNVDMDLANYTKATHGTVLTYNEYDEKWSPTADPYLGTLVSPHKNYFLNGAFPSSSPSFSVGDVTNAGFGDTFIVLTTVTLRPYLGDDITDWKLSPTSIENGWIWLDPVKTDQPAPFWNDDRAETYLLWAKKYHGSNNNWGNSVQFYSGGSTWSMPHYGFQVRGNANIELVQHDVLTTNIGTKNAIPYTIVDDANVYIVRRQSGADGHMLITSDDIKDTHYPVYPTSGVDYQQAQGFFIRHPYQRASDSRTSNLTINLSATADPYQYDNELHAFQFRATSGDDTLDSAVNNLPELDFLKEASDQDVLIYNGTTPGWEVATKPPLGRNELGDIGDVDVAGAANNDVLAWDNIATNWKPYTLPAPPALYIEKQYNFTGVIQENTGALRYYLPAQISEIRVTPYLSVASLSGRVTAVVKYNEVGVINAVLQTAETVGQEVVLTGSFPKGKYLTVDITEAGTNAQYLSLLITLKRA